MCKKIQNLGGQTTLHICVYNCVYIHYHTHKNSKHIAASTQAFCAIFLLDLLLSNI